MAEVRDLDIVREVTVRDESATDKHAVDRRLKEALRVRGPLSLEPSAHDEPVEKAVSSSDDFLKAEEKPAGSWVNAEVLDTPQFVRSPEEIEALRLQAEAEQEATREAAKLRLEEAIAQLPKEKQKNVRREVKQRLGEQYSSPADSSQVKPPDVGLQAGSK